MVIKSEFSGISMGGISGIGVIEGLTVTVPRINIGSPGESIKATYSFGYQGPQRVIGVKFMICDWTGTTDTGTSVNEQYVILANGLSISTTSSLETKGPYTINLTFSSGMKLFDSNQADHLWDIVLELRTTIACSGDSTIADINGNQMRAIAFDSLTVSSSKFQNLTASFSKV